MGNLGNFNANDIEPQSSFEPLPAGWYKAMITASEMKPTRAGTGQYLQLRIDVIEGEYENRVVFERLNLDNPNQTTVEIAQRALSAICHAVNVLTPNDSSDLHNIPLMVKLGIQPAGNGYEASNTVKGFEAVAGGAPAARPATAPAAHAQAAPAQQAAPAPAAAPAKKPWE